MQRGRIIQYNPHAGTGVLLVGEVQRAFEIAAWRGAEAPQLNRVTDVQEVEGVVLTVTPVSERALLAERASDLKAELGAIGNTLGALGSALGGRAAVAVGDAARNLGRSSAAGDAAAATASATAVRIDRPVIAGYAAFALATVALTFISIQVPFFGDRTLTLFAATGVAEQMGSSARVLLFAAYLSVLVPLIWKQRRAWLALAVPLVVLALMFWTAQRAVAAPFGGSDAIGMAEAFGSEAAAEVRRAASEMISFGLGFYASFAAALYLGWLAFRRGIARA